MTDTHRCPRRRAFVAVEITLWALAGGFAGFLLVALFDPLGQIKEADYAIVAIVGAAIGVGLNRSLKA